MLTKSALVLRDLEAFSAHNVRVGVTVTTLDQPLARLWEPRSASVQERLRVIDEARRAGLKTAVMFGPLLPFLSDGQPSLDAMFQRAADLKVDCIWVDTLNPRPRVWPSVAGLLNKKFPDLHEPYRRILFNRQARQTYREQLRDRVARAAQRASLADRTKGLE